MRWSRLTCVRLTRVRIACWRMRMEIRRQPVRHQHRDLRPQNPVDAHRLARRTKAHDATQLVMIRQGERRIPQPCRPLGERLRQRRAVQQRER